MYEAICNFFAVIFGYIMNFFYILLDFIGLPYLWLCILLFAAVTRLIFLPQKIGSTRKSILAPAINYDLCQLRKSYGSIKKDEKDRLKQYKNDIKAIHKKHKVSSGTGCLMTLLQLPIYVGLFYVIKNTSKYVPQLNALTEAERVNVNNFFGMSLEALPKEYGALGILIPLVVFIGFIIRYAPKFFGKGKKAQPTILVITFFQLILITWMSFCLPIAISLYWVVNDFVNLLIDYAVKSSLNKNSKIKAVLAETELLIAAEKEKEEAEKNINSSEGSEPVSEAVANT